MSNNATAFSSIAGTVYATARNLAGQWYKSDGTFETYNAGNYASYVIAATSIGGGYYSVDFADGVTNFDFRRTSSTPAETDAPFAMGEFAVETVVAPIDPTDTDNALVNAIASGTKSTDVDGTLTVKHSLEELIEADKYLRSKNSATGAQNTYPYRTIKNVPPGANGV